MHQQARATADPAMNVPGFTMDPAGVLRAGSLARLDWLDHGFGTRRSEGWPPGPCVTLKQIHSTVVFAASGPKGVPRAEVLGEGDALAAAGPCPWLTIRTADCVPLILADPVGRAAAVIHAGWRGAADGIAGAALDRLADMCGSRPGDLLAALGPAIGPCCFEVGPEVAYRFQPWWPERSDLEHRTRLDLPETLVRQLIHRGVSSSRISVARACTVCHPDWLHSWRRDGTASGRMVAAARILA